MNIIKPWLNNFSYFLAITIIVVRMFTWEMNLVKKYYWDFQHLLVISNQVLNCLYLDKKKITVSYKTYIVKSVCSIRMTKRYKN